MARIARGISESLPKPAELEFFCRLHDHLGTGKAIADIAKLLKIHKTVLYKRVDQLEAKVRPPGATWRLIERTSGRASAVTPEGELFYHDAMEALELYARNILRHARYPDEIIIGATNAITTYYLPLILSESRYLAEHPAVDVRVQEGEWFDLLRHLRQGTISFAIGPAVASGLGYTCERLTRVKRVLVCRPDHPRFASFQPDRDRFELDWLATETVFLLPEGAQIDYQSVAEKLPSPTPGVGRQIFLPNYSEMQAWVKHGLGVAIVHDRHLIPGDTPLVSIDLSTELGETEVELYLPAGGDQALSPAARELVAFIRRFEARLAAPATRKPRAGR